MMDSMLRTWSSVRSRDFTFVEKGLTEGDEILVGGNMNFISDGKFSITNPSLLIASDMTELKTFVGRRREQCFL
jgi:hypothetical protein